VKIVTGKQGKGVCNIVYNRKCNPKTSLAASSRRRAADASWQVDNRNKTDCWRRKSMMPDVSSRSKYYLNWMLDSSRQCHGVAKNRVERLSGLAPGLLQSYVPFSTSLPLSPRVSKRSLTAHTARTLSSASLQDSQHCRSYSAKSDVEVSQNRA